MQSTNNDGEVEFMPSFSRVIKITVGMVYARFYNTPILKDTAPQLMKACLKNNNNNKNGTKKSPWSTS